MPAVHVTETRENWELSANPYADFDQHLDRLEEKVRHQELQYAKFMSRRKYYAQNTSRRQFEKLINSVSLRLVYYDPSFDFTAPEELALPTCSHSSCSSTYNACCHSCMRQW